MSQGPAANTSSSSLGWTEICCRPVSTVWANRFLLLWSSMFLEWKATVTTFTADFWDISWRESGGSEASFWLIAISSHPFLYVLLMAFQGGSLSRLRQSGRWSYRLSTEFRAGYAFWPWATSLLFMSANKLAFILKQIKRNQYSLNSDSIVLYIDD